MDKEILKKNIAAHGEYIELQVLEEECAELIQAISKAKRGKLDLDNISEEIADVLICIEWIIDIYNIDKLYIQEWRNRKEKRIVERLNKNDFK